jgi:hypothetical protein
MKEYGIAADGQKTGANRTDKAAQGGPVFVITPQNECYFFRGGESMGTEAENDGKMSFPEETRKTRMPGRSGAFPYARAARLYFKEILELREEGFFLSTVCEILESRGLLPKGANPHSFRRAFRLESIRVKRVKNREKEDIRASGEAMENSAKREPGAARPSVSDYGGGSKTRLRPDNTFDIEFIDLDGLEGL